MIQKNGKIIAGIAALSIILVFGAIYFFMSVSAKNKEIKMRGLVSSQQEVNKANFDKMFKTISQVAEVADKYKESFKEVYIPIMEGRYKDNGLLMKWVQESNPNFDTKLYDRLITAIEANREEFFVEQKKLISYNNEHNVFVRTWPNTWFFSEGDTTSIVIVTSSVTKRAFETGEENDINLFK
jgi:hypothetical protein